MRLVFHGLLAGAPVAVTGQLHPNRTIIVTSLSNITSLLPSASQGQLSAPLTNPLRVLIINTRFTNGSPAVSNANIRALLPAVSSQLGNCSYGLMRVDPATRVMGPVDIGPPVGKDCPTDTVIQQWVDAANQQVLQQGIDPTWDYISYAFPDTYSCDWLAQAVTNCRFQDQGLPCWSSFNGQSINNLWVLVHEWGHHMGLGHSAGTVDGQLIEVRTMHTVVLTTCYF